MKVYKCEDCSGTFEYTEQVKQLHKDGYPLVCGKCEEKRFYNSLDRSFKCQANSYIDNSSTFIYDN